MLADLVNLDIAAMFPENHDPQEHRWSVGKGCWKRRAGEKLRGFGRVQSRRNQVLW
jgi:hypothetical protein